jgi:hypothetical protein
MAGRRNELSTIGWREWVSLPEVTSVAIKAKVDTGALTSTLHARDLVIERRGAEFWVDFEVNPIQRSKQRSTRVTHPIRVFKKVKSSTGHTESRPVIRTPIRLGDQEFDIDLTLTSRDAMGFRLLVGRSAIRRRFVVDPGRSFVHDLSTSTTSRRAHTT